MADITQKRFADGLYVLVWWSGTKRESDSKLAGFRKKEPGVDFRTHTFPEFGGRKLYGIYRRVTVNR